MRRNTKLSVAANCQIATTVYLSCGNDMLTCNTPERKIVFSLTARRPSHYLCSLLGNSTGLKAVGQFFAHIKIKVAEEVFRYLKKVRSLS